MSGSTSCRRCGDSPASDHERVALAGICPRCLARDLGSEFETPAPRPARPLRLDPGTGELNFLGPYRLIKKLGEGGMAAVYLAEDTRTSDRVAVKVLPKHQLQSDQTALKRFQREGAAAIRLSHPHLVRAFDAGEARGHFYYAMEYCEGESLDARLKREKVLPWRSALEIVLPVAQALSYAHRAGFVHRDVKPSNILVSRDGVPKLLDLGISKNIGECTASFRTESGIVIGTPHYISPEQARGTSAIDGRADIYSLGVTLYHLVTGRVPFVAASPLEVLAHHQHAGFPDPRDFCPDLPEPVVELLKKMLSKSPEQRHSDCSALARDLRNVMKGRKPAAAGDFKVMKAPSWIWGAAGLVALAALAFFLLGGKDGREGGANNPSISSKTPDRSREEGLIGYWKLDEEDGTTAIDSSGRSHDGTYSHGPRSSTEVPRLEFPDARSRSFDQSLFQSIVVPDSPELRLEGSFTLAAWIRTTQADSPMQQNIIEKFDWDGSAARGGYSFRLFKTRVLSLSTYQPGGSTGFSTAPRKIPINVWVHVAGVYDQRTHLARLYVNGQLDPIASNETASTFAPPAGSTQPLIIGSDYGSNAFQGNLDDVRIYNRALSEEEVVELACGSSTTKLASVKDLIAKLRSSHPTVPADAARRLRLRGDAALPLLEVAAKDPDREFSARSLAVILQITRHPSSESSVPPTPIPPMTGPRDLRDPDQPKDIVRGVAYEYYEGFWDLLPDFDALKPFSRGVSHRFDLSPARRNDGFAFRYKGFVNAPADGLYTFTTFSDDGSKLHIGSAEVVSNDGLHGLANRSGSIALKHGLHPITVTYFQSRSQKFLGVSWQGPGIAPQNMSPDVLYRLREPGETGTPPPIREPDAPAGLVPGLAYEYFHGDWDHLPEFDLLVPVSVGTITGFDLSPRQRPNGFALRFRGYIDAPRDGVYTFSTISDDGSKLFIGKVEVVSNDGARSLTEASGTIDLRAGKHALTVLYFQQSAGAQLDVTWTTPGGQKKPLPPEALYRVAVGSR